MIEAPTNGYPEVARDEFVGMVARKHISDLAADPFNFNIEGQIFARDLLYPELSRDDYILDIGCSSGEFVIEAAEITGIEAQIIGLDANVTPYSVFLNPNIDTSRFRFIQGDAQKIPLNDNSVRVATAHNTVYRVENVYQMLNEMKRVTEPNGLIIISTNGRGHAPFRHNFEQMAVAYVEAKNRDRKISRPNSPAQKCDLEALYAVIRHSGGLEVMARMHQDSFSVITADRVLDYELAIELSAAANGVSQDLMPDWREAVETIIGPTVRKDIELRQRRLDTHIADWRRAHPDQPQDNGLPPPKAYFADPVDRGMIVLRNRKAA